MTKCILSRENEPVHQINMENMRENDSLRKRELGTLQNLENENESLRKSNRALKELKETEKRAYPYMRKRTGTLRVSELEKSGLGTGLSSDDPGMGTNQLQQDYKTVV